MVVSFRQAAIKILEESNEPLTVSEITRRALEQKLITTGGATPQATMNAKIILDMKNKQEKSSFVRVRRGRYILNPNCEENK
jgi:restriction system protein